MRAATQNRRRRAEMLSAGTGLSGFGFAMWQE
jgi:hypothetical protein